MIYLYGVMVWIWDVPPEVCGGNVGMIRAKKKIMKSCDLIGRLIHLID